MVQEAEVSIIKRLFALVFLVAFGVNITLHEIHSSMPCSTGAETSKVASDASIDSIASAETDRAVGSESNHGSGDRGKDRHCSHSANCSILNSNTVRTYPPAQLAAVLPFKSTQVNSIDIDGLTRPPRA